MFSYRDGIRTLEPLDIHGVSILELIMVLVAGFLVTIAWLISIQPPAPVITLTAVSTCPNVIHGYSKGSSVKAIFKEDFVQRAFNIQGDNIHAPGYICIAADFPLKVGNQASRAWITTEVTDSSPLLVLSIKRPTALSITFYSRGGLGLKETFCTTSYQGEVEVWNPKTGKTSNESLAKYCASI